MHLNQGQIKSTSKKIIIMLKLLSNFASKLPNAKLPVFFYYYYYSNLHYLNPYYHRFIMMNFRLATNLQSL